MVASNNYKLAKLLVFFQLVLLTSLLSCSHEYHSTEDDINSYIKRRSEPSYTIIVGHSECTECMDAYIYDGVVKVPADLKGKFGDTLAIKDIMLVGNFPFDLVDPGNLFFNSETRFKITGKLIGPNTKHSAGATPIFYVEQWKKIK